MVWPRFDRGFVIDITMHTAQKYVINGKEGRSLPRKIAIMVISLVKERAEKPSKEIEEEILKELKELRIPWMKKWRRLRF